MPSVLTTLLDRWGRVASLGDLLKGVDRPDGNNDEADHRHDGDDHGPRALEGQAAVPIFEIDPCILFRAP